MFCWECGHIAERLCDFLVEGGKTCDRALCREHGSHEGTNLDFCSTHGQPVLGL